MPARPRTIVAAPTTTGTPAAAREPKTRVSTIAATGSVTSSARRRSFSVALCRSRKKVAPPATVASTCVPSASSGTAARRSSSGRSSSVASGAPLRLTRAYAIFPERPIWRLFRSGGTTPTTWGSSCTRRSESLTAARTSGSAYGRPALR